MEILLKWIIGGFLAGIICRNFFQWNPRDRHQNVFALGATVSCAIGLYFVSKDTVYFAQIALQLWKTQAEPLCKVSIGTYGALARLYTGSWGSRRTALPSVFLFYLGFPSLFLSFKCNTQFIKKKMQFIKNK